MKNHDLSGCLNAISVDQLIKGKRSAQHSFYQLLAPKMLSLCSRYASCKEEAEDMVQDGFIKVFRNLSQYSGEGNFVGWIRRIFINTAIEYWRKRTFVEAIVDDSHHVALQVGATSGYDSLAHADLIKTIDSLSEGYRTIFKLYVVEGFSHKEIADLLNITESTSKSQLSRAKTILQKSLVKLGIAA